MPGLPKKHLHREGFGGGGPGHCCRNLPSIQRQRMSGPPHCLTTVVLKRNTFPRPSARASISSCCKTCAMMQLARQKRKKKEVQSQQDHDPRSRSITDQPVLYVHSTQCALHAVLDRCIPTGSLCLLVNTSSNSYPYRGSHTRYSQFFSHIMQQAAARWGRAFGSPSRSKLAWYGQKGRPLNIVRSACIELGMSWHELHIFT